jgi:hypothetical protein
MFIPLMLLALESSEVIALRTIKLMSGDEDAAREVRLMPARNWMRLLKLPRTSWAASPEMKLSRVSSKQSERTRID